jgi:phospholipid/cholesterol/gamma-HCH transport system substrate-binding protein
MVNLKKGSAGLNENMVAAKLNYLLRGYFKKQKKEEDKRKHEELEKCQAGGEESDKAIR